MQQRYVFAILKHHFFDSIKYLLMAMTYGWHMSIKGRRVKGLYDETNGTEWNGTIGNFCSCHPK